MDERIQTLHEHIVDAESTSKSISNEMKTILSDFNIKEISLLSILSQKLKINQTNVDTILTNSESFKCLKEACLFYKDIIENSSIKQKNFVNILIIDHLLLNITESNIEKHVIYANLFLYDMDINSMYKIIVTHCFGRPNSIYEITLFWKRLIEIHKSQEMIPSFLHNNLTYLDYRCELGKIDYFLRYFNIFEKKPNVKLRVIKKNKSQREFEMIKNGEVFNSLFKAIYDDNIEELCKISSNKNFNVNCSILYSMETINNWPFDFKDKIQIIKLAAFSKSVKVFKYLILNHAETDDDLINYAIAGGNAEIIRICEQKKCEISLKSFEYAIKYYQNDIFLWLIEQNPEIFYNNISKILNQSIICSNPQALLIMLDNDKHCLDHLNIVNFKYYEDEWQSFFFTIQSFEDRIRMALINSNFFFDLNSRSFKKYLQSKGEFDQYKNKNKNKLLVPPYPNDLVWKVIDRFYYSDTSLKASFQRCCMKRIELGDIDLLYEIEKSNPSILQIVYDEVFNNKWMTIILNNFRKGPYKPLIKVSKFFIERCLKDVESNIDVQTEGFCYSCFYGKIDFVTDFLNRKYVDVNSKKYLLKQTPLILAIRGGFTSIVHLLIKDERIDVNLYCDENHQTPFYYACEDNYVELVDLLLNDERVDINIPNNEGKTPFLVACEKGYDKIVRRLLQRKDLEKGFPYKLAVVNYQYKVVKLLIENGININNENEKNLLQVACLFGDLKMVELLFSTDLNKDVVDEEGRTLLHLAYMNGRQDIINFLVEKGFDEKAKDKSGLTPAQYSQLTGIYKHEKNPLMRDYMLIHVFNQKKLAYSFSEFCDSVIKSQIQGLDSSDMNNLFINLEDYSFTNIKIDEGSYYSVFLGRDKKNNKEVAVKFFNKFCNDRDYCIQQFTQLVKESLILKKADHPAIIKCIGINSIPTQTKDIYKPIILHEHLTNKTLEYQLLHENLNSTKKYISLLGISHAMKCLHKQGIAHLNLKPDSILLDEDFYPKISCFRYSFINDRSNCSIYTAPEIKSNNEYGQSADVFSFAMIAYYIVTSNNPSCECSNAKNMNNNYRPQFNDNVNVAMKEFISLCWNNEGEKRPSFDLIFDFLASFYLWHNEDLDKNEIDSYIQKLNNSELAFNDLLLNH